MLLKGEFRSGGTADLPFDSGTAAPMADTGFGQDSLEEKNRIKQIDNDAQHKAREERKIRRLQQSRY